MNNLLYVLKTVYLRGGISLQSNFARENAKVVAALASLGYLSTKEEADTFSNTWRPTFAGLLKLTEKGLV